MCAIMSKPFMSDYLHGKRMAEDREKGKEWLPRTCPRADY